MAVPCVGSPTGCLGSPASCCSGRRCSTPPMTSGQRRSPEPPPKATRLDPLHPTKNSDHVTEHWSLIPGRKSHHGGRGGRSSSVTEPGFLQSAVLIGGRNTGVTVARHGKGGPVTIGSTLMLCRHKMSNPTL